MCREWRGVPVVLGVLQRKEHIPVKAAKSAPAQGNLLLARVIIHVTQDPKSHLTEVLTHWFIASTSPPYWIHTCCVITRASNYETSSPVPESCATVVCKPTGVCPFNGKYTLVPGSLVPYPGSGVLDCICILSLKAPRCARVSRIQCLSLGHSTTWPALSYLLFPRRS